MPLNVKSERALRRLLRAAPTGQRAPLRVKVGSAWHKRAEELVYTCREPKPIERLAARGYTRRVSEAGVWFEDGEGRRTPIGADTDAAIAAAMEAIRD